MIPPQIALALSIANAIRVNPQQVINRDTGFSSGKCACGRTISYNKPMCRACRIQLEAESEAACK